MSTTKTVTENLAYLREQLSKVDCPPSIGLDMLHTAMVLEGLLELQQQLSALSTSITSDTSDSGIKTEGSQSPTGKPGGSQAPSIRGEQTGKTGQNTGESLENE